jgi:hypothetical protein
VSSNFNINARFAAVGQQQVLGAIQSMQAGMSNLTRQAQASAGQIIDDTVKAGRLELVSFHSYRRIIEP